MFKKVNKAFTLIEILVVISMIMILLVWLSKIDLSKWQNQQKSLSFSNKIKIPLETTITNALIWKWVGSDLMVPKSWKIEIWKYATAMWWTWVLNIYYQTWRIYQLNEAISSDKYYDISKIECLDISWTPLYNIAYWTILVKWSNIEMWSECWEWKSLRIITQYKNEFPNVIYLNTINWVVTKDSLAGTWLLTYSTPWTCPTWYHDEWLWCINDIANCTIPNWVWQKTWNWSSWGICSVISCNTHYTQSWNSCNADTQVYTCTWLPTNAVWNTVSSYTQTWNRSIWSPLDTASTYSLASSTTSCNYKCNTNYTWNWSSCIANGQIRTCWWVIPANAIATTATTYNQIWNWSSWTPTTNWWQSQATCDFNCNNWYTWNWSSCIANTWNSWAWWTCSVTCWWWTQSRSVQCQNYVGTVLADTNCLTAKPAISQACNTRVCPPTMIFQMLWVWQDANTMNLQTINCSNQWWVVKRVPRAAPHGYWDLKCMTY